jgi:hypothetical protein
MAIILGGVNAPSSPGAFSPLAPLCAWNASPTTATNTPSVPGTIDSFYAYCYQDAVAQHKLTLLKNGANTLLAVTFPNASGELSAQDTTHSVHVVPGDILYLRIDRLSGTANARGCRWHFRFTPD